MYSRSGLCDRATTKSEKWYFSSPCVSIQVCRGGRGSSNHFYAAAHRLANRPNGASVEWWHLSLGIFSMGEKRFLSLFLSCIEESRGWIYFLLLFSRISPRFNLHYHSRATNWGWATYCVAIFKEFGREYILFNGPYCIHDGNSRFLDALRVVVHSTGNLLVDSARLCIAQDFSGVFCRDISVPILFL